MSENQQRRGKSLHGFIMREAASTGQPKDRLTKAQTDTLRELSRNDGRGLCFWARPASCAALAKLGLAETYTPPSVVERPRMKARPYRITDAGRAALQGRSSNQ